MKAMCNIVLGPVRFQLPSLKGDVIAWRMKPEPTETGLLYWAAAATIAPMSAPIADRHYVNFSYDLETRKKREKKWRKTLYRAKKALIDWVEAVFDWE